MGRWVARGAVLTVVVTAVVLLALHHGPNARALPASKLADSSGSVSVPVGFAGLVVLAGTLFAAFALLQLRARRRH